MSVLSRYLLDLHVHKLGLRFRYFSKVIVSLSGGKDSALALLYAIELFGAKNIVANYQVILEDHPGTLEHCQALCVFFGIDLYTCQMSQYTMVCGSCGNHHLTADPMTCWCHKCKDKANQVVDHRIESIHGLIAWRCHFTHGLAD